MAETTLSPSRAGRGQWPILVLSLLVGLYGLSYLAGHPAPPAPAANPAGRAVLVFHAATAGGALLLGPWQFFSAIRRRRPRLHRWTGRSYVALCIISSLAGGILAWNVTSGTVARTGFGLLDIAWLSATLLGYRAAVRRDFASHRRWMIRSFALTFAAVTLRLYLPLAFLPGLSFDLVYPITAWACWVPNLVIAEAWLRRDRA